ncbi:unnamed protein product [Mycetohabitans rhizoxinica HKI 454]|uniref:Uncharacterized protein n=1 Tax=Mycetohabitans rhizoxinica (strain DSM 19002 / CIP 109453 / HKI 454) TaxID=882378 RepID=E5AT13_MYCRK|nr:unnamed protein product [Mycetohabitans rhizoxinica HKI 454]
MSWARLSADQDIAERHGMSFPLIRNTRQSNGTGS